MAIKRRGFLLTVLGVFAAGAAKALGAGPTAEDIQPVQEEQRLSNFSCDDDDPEAQRAANRLRAIRDMVQARLRGRNVIYVALT